MMTWDGSDRRNGEKMATAAEVGALKRDVKQRFDEQDKTLNKLKVAMFAETDNNEFGQKGMMPIMRRLDAHIDLLCKIGKWCKHLGLTLLAAGASIATIGAAIGWWK